MGGDLDRERKTEKIKRKEDRSVLYLYVGLPPDIQIQYEETIELVDLRSKAIGVVYKPQISEVEDGNVSVEESRSKLKWSFLQQHSRTREIRKGRKDGVVTRGW
ncbi:unnamed protein product [Lactuca virosa]|uniref:Uncharacterized protein n=1 Tax=Lactuca virosa TaxID=75947 RepID=A0AAU9PBA0_9ASTR|nr:unnamed protein product [Lactuca virosa]